MRLNRKLKCTIKFAITNNFNYICIMNNKEKDELLVELLKKIVPEQELQTVEVYDFLEECVKMIQLYAKKNHDYGNSFTQGMNVIGLPYGVGRMYDKMNRIITLLKVKECVTDESIKDTIQDLACYSVMTSVHLNNQTKNEIRNVDFEGD